MEIHRQIRRVLMDEWNPIGVKDIAEAADEYDSYIGHIHGWVAREARIIEIAEYLRLVEVDWMGLRPSTQSCRDAVAGSLKRLIQK